MEGHLAKARDAVDQLQVAFGTGLNEGIKTALGVVNTELPKLTEAFTQAGSLIGTALTEAVSGDTERLQRIGELIGATIGSGIKIGVTRGFMEGTEATYRLLEDINPLRNLPGFKESDKISDYISGGKGQVTSGQASDAVQAMRDRYAQVTPSVMGYTPATAEQIREGQDNQLRATIERQTMILEAIKINTAEKRFPN